MQKQKTFSAVIVAIFFFGSAFSFTVKAQSAPPSAPAGRQAIEVRKAAFALIGNSFKPIGDTLQGKIPYNQAEVQKRAARVVLLADWVGEAFPDASNTGLPDTKAKPEVWSDRTTFDKRLSEFREHAATLAKVSATETTASDAFKTAAAAVAKDCKSCHDAFKLK
jgi:cytochrome c556